VQGASPILDNVLLVRHVEQHGRLVRLLSIIKLRGSGFDTRVYTFEITDHGIEVGAEWNPEGTKGAS
jgi:circadian clock protein KaiC